MKSLSMLVCSASLISAFAGVAQGADTPAAPPTYKQKMHDCATQMKTDHPEMNHDARHKACRKQLGPSPKVPASAAPTTPAPAASNP